MRLRKLSVENLGVFRGRHEFDFAPASKRGGKHRHLTVVAGHNGAGKTTLFQACALALHGAMALGERVSRQTYNDFLINRLHRRISTRTRSGSKTGSVSLEFEYVKAGKPLRIEVARRWERHGKIVDETLSVLCDGQPPEVDPSDYQIWLNDLFPPGLAPLCFFDAERLEAMATPEAHDRVLRDTLRRLLGLDLINRLRSDLEHYVISNFGGRRGEDVRQEVLVRQAELDALDSRLGKLRAEAEALAAEENALDGELTRQQHLLAGEGGRYAARRPALQERLTALEAEIELAAKELRELSSELMPFALAPELCEALSERLHVEAGRRRQRLADEILRERLDEIKAALEGDDLWQGLNVGEKVRSTLHRRLSKLLAGSTLTSAGDAQPLVHQLGEHDYERLQAWISEVLGKLPQQVQRVGDRLRVLEQERHQIEMDLERVPGPEVLAPIEAEINRVNAALVELRQRRATLSERIGALQYQRDEKARQLQRTVEQLSALQTKERRLAFAARSKLVLRTYQDALARQRIAALEKALPVAFNAMCRKENLLGGVRIDSDNWHVELYDTHGNVLPLSDLSAGERQLYTLALLQALRQVSGRKLPLLMDMPLARLDEIHRWRVMRDYIPNVSAQVVLFATDSELDAAMLAHSEPWLARVYRLNIDTERQEAHVESEHSAVLKGLVLYKNDVAESAGRGDGRAWRVSPEQVNGHSDLRRGLLPATARRLILVDPVTGKYKWRAIAELEKLTGESNISRNLRDGIPLHELWKQKWTRCLKKAGYDSVAISDINGPTEYVLRPSKVISLDTLLTPDNRE